MKSGLCVWVTGLPGSGKSVISNELIRLLRAKRIRAQLLSSDSLRRVMTPKPTYSLEERDNVYATLVYVARLLTQNDVNVVIDATGNLRRHRENARKSIQLFMEAYLTCPLEICMERERNRKKTYHAPKRIYADAIAGEAPTVPGIGQPYEPPLNPEVTIDTTKCTPKQCAQEVFRKIFQEWNHEG